MKLFVFFITMFIMLFFISCGDSSNSSSLCSVNNPNGKCEDTDKYCEAGVCLEKVKKCDPVCTDEQICLDGICEDTSKEVDCMDIAPDNASSVIIKVVITYNKSRKEWTTPDNCEWKCNEDYKKNSSETSCIKKQEEDYCEDVQCGEHAFCKVENKQGTCVCDSGYKLNNDNVSCSDINECDNNDGGCNQNCKNTEGGFECSCEEGFTIGLDGKTCSDINECQNNNGGCDVNATCNNIAGSFECICKTGYTGDGQTCTVIEICKPENNPCNENYKTVCKDDDNNGIAECLCDAGYKLNEETSECENINECDINHLLANCNSEATCNDTQGSYECICNDGYEGDGIVCNDIDECATGADNCDNNATCTNKAGNDGKFECTCNDGYHGDGVTSCLEQCGDGIKTPSEACDDGNNVDTDSCLNTCVEASCGDGIVQAGVEACDTSGIDTINCNAGNCTTASCGDSYTNTAAGEQCDDGGDSINCDANCTTASCGDGYTNTIAGEQCDDANNIDDDECSNSCADVNECAINTDDCDDDAICTNTIGGFQCNCNIGYKDTYGDGTECLPTSCKVILENGYTQDGIYEIDPDEDGNSINVYCDMNTDGGGWTLVASANATIDDRGVDYNNDLTTLNPISNMNGLWTGMRPVITGNSDIRFTCSVTNGEAFDVDLSFYNMGWYAELTASNNDVDTCFEEGNGNGYTGPWNRRDNIHDIFKDSSDQYDGFMEGEDGCGSTDDFTVDFDDRGMDGDEFDGTDWGEDDGQQKCGNVRSSSGAWFVWVREL